MMSTYYYNRIIHNKNIINMKIRIELQDINYKCTIRVQLVRNIEKNKK